MRRLGTWGGTIVLGLGMLAASGCRSEAPARPDLVLITIDRLAADRLTCFDGPSDAGASLCALARDGFLLAWATTPAIGEARVAGTTLTGRSPAAHGLDDSGATFLPDAEETIAETLAQAGYATAAFVASPRLNRSRRLDQGFDLYADPLAVDRPGGSDAWIEQASAIQRWIEATASPRFVWIHLRSEAGLAAIDRLVDRLARELDPPEDRPGILVAALAGEPGVQPGPGTDAAGRRMGREAGSLAAAPAVGADAAGREGAIAFRTHRIPLLWRPPRSSPPRGTGADPIVRAELASLLDVVPTLREAAGLPAATPRPAAGRPLGTPTSPHDGSPGPEEGGRFLLLRGPSGSGEVGVASASDLYVRRSSPLDGSGRPVPTPELAALDARFLRIDPTAASASAPRSAGLEAGPWRRDVLRAESPVPRLEFHLARLLAEEATGGLRE